MNQQHVIRSTPIGCERSVDEVLLALQMFRDNSIVISEERLWWMWYHMGEEEPEDRRRDEWTMSIET